MKKLKLFLFKTILFFAILAGFLGGLAGYIAGYSSASEYVDDLSLTS